jgi:hypothetical protein
MLPGLGQLHPDVDILILLAVLGGDIPLDGGFQGLPDFFDGQPEGMSMCIDELTLVEDTL